MRVATRSIICKSLLLFFQQFYEFIIVFCSNIFSLFLKLQIFNTCMLLVTTNNNFDVNVVHTQDFMWLQNNLHFHIQCKNIGVQVQNIQNKHCKVVVVTTYIDVTYVTCEVGLRYYSSSPTPHISLFQLQNLSLKLDEHHIE